MQGLVLSSGSGIYWGLGPYPPENKEGLLCLSLSQVWSEALRFGPCPGEAVMLICHHLVR